MGVPASSENYWSAWQAIFELGFSMAVKSETL